jgi:hypothetical protein
VKRRPRKSFKLLLFLLAGAIINVAVAWGCALYSPFWPDHGWRHAECQIKLVDWSEDTIPFAIPAKLQGDRENGVVESIGLQLCFMSTSELVVDAATRCSAIRMRSGMPMYSLTASRWMLPEGPDIRLCGGQFIAFTNRRGSRAELDWLSEGGRIWPLKPLWPGFAINTIFYAAIVWFLFFAPGAIRRRVRRKRGQCAACAYPVGASDSCTECGGAVQRSR